MNKEYILEKSLKNLLDNINMPSEVADAVLLCCEDHSSKHIPGIEVLTKHLVESVKSRENGAWQRFPEDIFIATMGCFSRFVREHFVSYGYYGFDRDFWTTRQVGAKLFRIGELEYELIDGDDKYIHLHIPSDANMKPSFLNLSLDKSREFFTEYFPEKENCSIHCESWLLAPKLKSLLKDDSNIIHFQNAFEIIQEYPEAMDFLEWVFHVAGGQQESVRFEDLPEDTSLQRGAKQLLCSGGCIGSAEGVLTRRF